MFEEAGLPVKIAGKIKDFNPEEYGMDKPFIRKQDPFTVFAMASAYQAMNDSGLVVGENIDAARLSTYVSSGIGGFQTIQREVTKMAEDPTGQWISPLFVPTMIADMAAGQIAIKYGAQGSCIGIVTACATATHSIGEAYRAIVHSRFRQCTHPVTRRGSQVRKSPLQRQPQRFRHGRRISCPYP